MLPLWAGALPSSQGHPLLANDGKGTQCYVIASRLTEGQVCWFFTGLLNFLFNNISSYLCTCLLMCNCMIFFCLGDAPVDSTTVDKELWLRFGVTMVLCSALHCRLTQSVLSQSRPLISHAKIKHWHLLIMHQLSVLFFLLSVGLDVSNWCKTLTRIKLSANRGCVQCFVLTRVARVSAFLAFTLFCIEF